MASLQSNSTFSFKHHSANGIRCSSNIAIADHFPSKTFSFKHHLTGEAWLAEQFSFKHHLTGDGQLAERLDTWVSYDVAYGQPLPWLTCPGDAPGAVEPHGVYWIGDR